MSTSTSQAHELIGAHSVNGKLALAAMGGLSQPSVLISGS